MEPWRPCQHCTESGCAIYATRPRKPCVEFVCAWLRAGSSMPEELRPDRAGVIVVPDRKWREWTVITAVATGETIPQAALDWLMTHAERTRTPLVLYEYIAEGGAFKGVRNRGFGPPAFVEAVRVSLGPQDIFRI